VLLDDVAVVYGVHVELSDTEVGGVHVVDVEDVVDTANGSNARKGLKCQNLIQRFHKFLYPNILQLLFCL